MADLQTLNLYTKPKERKVSPPSQIGGSVGFLDESFELMPNPEQIVANGGQFIASGISAIGEVVTQISSLGRKTITETVSTIRFNLDESLTFDKPQAKSPELIAQESRELRARIRFVNITEQDQKRVAREQELAESLKEKRINVNTLVGFNNVLYENSVNIDGALRLDVQVEYDRKNSEMQAAQIKASRDSRVILAIGGKLRSKDYFMRQDMSDERTGQNMMSAVG